MDPDPTTAADFAAAPHDLQVDVAVTADPAQTLRYAEALVPDAVLIAARVPPQDARAIASALRSGAASPSWWAWRNP